MSSTRESPCCQREAGFHAPGCAARDFDAAAHDAALSNLRDALTRAKAYALEVASFKVNFWGSSLLFAIERAEFELRYYLDVEMKRREDEEKRKAETE